MPSDSKEQFDHAVLASELAAAPAENFPRFIVPGREQEMAALNAMHRLHYPPAWLDYPHRDPAAGLCTLWDEWLPGPCLWADTADLRVCDGKVGIAQRLKNSFLNKFIDAEGYVAAHQHEGIGHVHGWPFPYWIGSPGAVGAHFSAVGTHSAVLPEGAPVVKTTAGWVLAGAEDRGLGPDGWRFTLTAAQATITVSLGVIEPRVSPFLQLRWSAKNPGSAQPFIEWETEERPGFSPDRRMHFPLPTGVAGSITCEMIPVHRHPHWRGRVTRLRVGFGNPAAGAEVVVQALFSQYDTRHNINNFDFIRGAIDTFLWTGDAAFMRAALPRLRQALRYAEAEFHTREHNCVLTPWVGHEGTTGLVRHADGTKTIIPGRGIGSNYWDLLPFGHKDAYATIRYHDTLVRMAALERDIDRHPGWEFPTGDRFEARDLEQHAAAVKAEGNRIFWSDETGRFVAGPDTTGQRHDYGFTFLNTDAIHYGFATEAHARQILDWLEGRRIVAGDTSTGADIYRFRFGPRSTTRRNLGYYFWGWSDPEQFTFGGQVQDGGAVLGWSYMDLSARLKVAGPDNAWTRLREIAAWFDEVQAAGGYRAYYQKQGVVLQGDGTAGGLGLDREFFESLLVPQIMLRGFLGLAPTADGCRIEPRLPADFPELTIDRIRLKGLVLAVTASRDAIVLRKVSGTPGGPFTVDATGFKAVPPIDWAQVEEVRLTR